MTKTLINKCHCCDSRVLYLHGDCIQSDSVPSEMIPVADLSMNDLRVLLDQISEHLSQE